MDYSNYRRSTNVMQGPPALDDKAELMAYMLRHGLTPEQMQAISDGGGYIPNQLDATPQQMGSPLGGSMGIRDLEALVTALRAGGRPVSLEPERPVAINAPKR